MLSYYVPLVFQLHHRDYIRVPIPPKNPKIFLKRAIQKNPKERYCNAYRISLESAKPPKNGRRNFKNSPRYPKKIDEKRVGTLYVITSVGSSSSGTSFTQLFKFLFAMLEPIDHGCKKYHSYSV